MHGITLIGRLLTLDYQTSHPPAAMEGVEAATSRSDLGLDITDFAVPSLLRETSRLVNHFYDSLVNDLFVFNMRCAELKVLFNEKKRQKC